MRRIGVLVSALVVLSTLPSSAQTLQSYRDLSLRVNVDDQLQIVDQAGRAATGRLTKMTSEALVLQTPDGEQRFAIGAIRTVDVIGHAMSRGAAIGAVAFLGLNALAAARNKDAGGASGAIGSAAAGAGIGVGIGAMIPQRSAHYTVPDSGMTSPAATADRGRFFDIVALRVNLDDTIRVATESGDTVTGQLSDLTDDDLTLATDAGRRTLTRGAIREISRPEPPIRAAALIGAATGAVSGALAGCSGSDRTECFDGALLLGGLGAGLGAFVGALIPQRTIVYPVPGSVMATVTPLITTAGLKTGRSIGAGVHVQVRW